MSNQNSNIGFQNPAFNESYEIEKENGLSRSRIETSTSLNLINEPSSQTNESYHRRLSSFPQDIDLVLCGNVYTIKQRTYKNLKTSLQMLKPCAILVIMIIFLVAVFRINLFVSQRNDVEDELNN
jgi:hypothetical protein